MDAVDDSISPDPSTLSPSVKSDTPVSSEPETIPDNETRLSSHHTAESEPIEPNEPVQAISPSPAERVISPVEQLVTNTDASSEYCQCPPTVGTDSTDSGKQNEEYAGLPDFVTKLKDMEVVDGSPVTLSVQVKGKEWKSIRTTQNTYTGYTPLHQSYKTILSTANTFTENPE